MYFEFIKQAKIMLNGIEYAFEARTSLYELCRSIEMNARTHTDRCVIDIRQALEILTKVILIQGEYHFPDDPRRPEHRLNNMINECYHQSFITKDQKGELHYLRTEMNQYVHISISNLGECEYSIEKKGVKSGAACNYVKRLYEIMSSIFRYDGKAFRKEWLPIGNYEITKCIDADSVEDFVFHYKYVAKEEKDGVENYVYIRPFPKDESLQRKLFYERDGFVQKFLRNMDDTVHIISGTILETSDSCDVMYVCYYIKKNTQTLDVLDRAVNKEQALDITLQIVRGLLSLLQNGEKIHHRGIRPVHIFVTADRRGKYHVKLGGFETAKVESDSVYIKTVGINAKEKMETNCFIPLEVRNKDIDELQGIDWEKVDVYSMAVLLLYCLDRKEVADTIDEGVFYDYFSDEFCDVLCDILMNSINEKPSLEELEKALEKELKSIRER